MKNNKYNCLDSNNFELVIRNFNILFDSSNYEITSSVVPIDINDLSDEEKSKAKIIIVGSITPWNGKGWFYTAPRTKMYKILDQVIFINQGKIVLNEDADTIRNKRQTTIDKLFREEFKC